MMLFHEPLSFIAGDSWEIDGLLTDQNGVPVDLTAATLEWTLLDKNGSVLANQNTTWVTIQTTSTPGAVTIRVERGVTLICTPGRYVDAIRVTTAGESATMWEGIINVQEDPFYQTDEVL